MNDYLSLFLFLLLPWVLVLLVLCCLPAPQQYSKEHKDAAYHGEEQQDKVRGEVREDTKTASQ